VGTVEQSRRILEDDRNIVPPVPDAAAGLAWLRASVPRFASGERHSRLRALTERVLAELDVREVAAGARRLAAAGLDARRVTVRALLDDEAAAECVLRIGPVYRAGDDPAADEAVERLVDRFGGRSEETAARIGVLVQACEATAALIAGADPPAPATARLVDGQLVEVPLDGVPFGAGRHACPGEALARAIARAVTGPERFRALHAGPAPLLLPNGWDAGSVAFLARSFEAVGTTSLGVALAAGKRDGAGTTRDETVELTARAAHLCLLTVDVEGGLSDDPAEVAELAEQLAALGAVGVNLEDGARDPALHARIVAAVKEGAPRLFVNARADTFWLGGPSAGVAETTERLRRYAAAGADGVFVPGVRDEHAVAELVAATPLPLNLLWSPGTDLARLGELGVRRVSLGSLLARAALGTVGALAGRIAARETVEVDAPAYDEAAALF
jgi:2-methylisocitrate lyase-like PEP mutase family enzyme